ncbi:prephenate dehydrogenase/arogenate dehydrogenase family protein [Desulfovibrio legallii]|uniref:Prephenate dehydrogenase n=1 Tax=Desulfovibrio legallii TaxID=571438 RepID=A0A1G7IPP2_9BACT|nr:prephenate dehydrogenase/arogenate dehydrogenase family protein [Desulfovibrio legallii]SDF14516.1 prephenate dehydrogenase [Desulfovibrio legallii]
MSRTPTIPQPAATEGFDRALPLLFVGSRGRMGAMLLARAAAAGLNARGVDQPLTPAALAPACADAGLVLLCVPAAVVPAVLASLIPHLPPSAVLADITSVKERPLRQMEAAWPGPVVGTHPLFGPKPDPHGPLPVAIVPGRRVAGHGGDTALPLVEGFFRALGFQTFRTTARQHDEAMARIQSMNFITNLAYFALLAGQDDLLPFLTPSFRRRRDAARKMLTEDAALFTGLFEANPHSYEAVRQYRQLLNLAAAGDVDLLCQRARWWWPDDEDKE